MFGANPNGIGPQFSDDPATFEPIDSDDVFYTHLFVGGNVWCVGGRTPGDQITYAWSNTAIDDFPPRHFVQISVGGNATDLALEGLVIYGNQ